MKKSFGAAGEGRVRLYLRLRGYKILQSNYKIRGGEIDIIAQRGKYLCFVEVKARASGGMGAPAEYVTAAKQRRIIKAAYSYLCRNKIELMPRFDVAEVVAGKGFMRVNYIKSAFEVNSENDPANAVKL